MNRRSFCIATGASLVVLPLGCGGPATTNDDLTTPPSADLSMGPTSCGPVSGGKASDIATGTAVFLQTSEIFVCRDAGGLFALTSVCTHQGCDVDFVSAGNGFSCPCHGATYTFTGTVTGGPAPSSLVHYALCVDPAGNITIDPSTTVAASTRTAG